ncbi:MAG: LLM class flavin-dependent oxidoreductase [Acidimicrobiaceae bacterium]|nr:LLM class flavin-dependent oxidoreductase [Acidimicrobiaceae bacterium]
MKIGVLLPTFRRGPADAFDFAARAAGAQLDGVFAYDHLWPMGSPERPALAPFAVLAAVARRHRGLVVGPLVARVGIVGTTHLVEQFTTLELLAPGRVIAALGTGDRLSAAENLAYGVDYGSTSQRRRLLEAAGASLIGRMPLWIGGGAHETNVLARSLGATINLWGAAPEIVGEAALTGPVNWAGPVPDDLPGLLDALRDARATWAVFTPDVDLTTLQQWRHSQ